MSANGLVVRAVRAGDLPRINAIEQACFSNPWTEEALSDELARSWARMLVAVDSDAPGSEVLAFVNYWVVADEVHVLNVATDPAQRRRGLARALIARMIEAAREERARTLLLEVRASNVPAIALYTQFGFRAVGTRPRYYDDGEDATLMTAVI